MRRIPTLHGRQDEIICFLHIKGKDFQLSCQCQIGSIYRRWTMFLSFHSSSSVAINFFFNGSLFVCEKGNSKSPLSFSTKCSSNWLFVITCLLKKTRFRLSFPCCYIYLVLGRYVLCPQQWGLTEHCHGEPQRPCLLFPKKYKLVVTESPQRCKLQHRE